MPGPRPVEIVLQIFLSRPEQLHGTSTDRLVPGNPDGLHHEIWLRFATEATSEQRRVDADTGRLSAGGLCGSESRDRLSLRRHPDFTAVSIDARRAARRFHGCMREERQLVVCRNQRGCVREQRVGRSVQFRGADARDRVDCARECLVDLVGGLPHGVRFVPLELECLRGGQCVALARSHDRNRVGRQRQHGSNAVALENHRLISDRAKSSPKDGHWRMAA